MNCCGINTTSGDAAAGGGGAPVAYQSAYEVDWREAFSDIGAVDLNSPGATLSYDGITWQTPSLANGYANQVSALTSWALTANGLEAVDVNGGSIAANTFSYPAIFASLSAIGANTATPFEADPTRRYLLQVFVSSSNPTVNDEYSGVGLYKPNGIPTGGYSTSVSAFGQRSGTAEIPVSVGGNTGSPASLERVDLTPVGDVSYRLPVLNYAGSGKTIDFYNAPYDSGEAFAWPSNSDLRFVGSYSENTEMDNDTPGDPFEGWDVFMLHSARSPSTYSAVIQRFRLLQF